MFQCWVFFALEFSFTQIYVAFRLKIGQRVRLRQRFIIFQLNSIISTSEMALFKKFFFRCSLYFGQIPSFWPSKWNFFRKFLFWCSFYFTMEFKFAQIHAAFQLELGQRWWLLRRFIIFSVKFHVSASEMAFYSKIFLSVFILFCVEIHIDTNLYCFSIGDGSITKTSLEVLRFSAKFHHVGLQNKNFSENFHFGIHFILRQNSNSHKCMQLFN